MYTKRANKKKISYSLLVQMAGIEPAREYKSRRILSPVRLPVSPHLRVSQLTRLIILRGI